MSEKMTREDEERAQRRAEATMRFMEAMQEDPAFQVTWRMLALSPTIQCNCGRCSYVKLMIASRLISQLIPSKEELAQLQARAEANGEIPEGACVSTEEEDIQDGRDLYFQLIDEGRDQVSIMRMLCAMITGLMFSLASTRPDDVGVEPTDEADEDLDDEDGDDEDEETP